MHKIVACLTVSLALLGTPIVARADPLTLNARSLAVFDSGGDFFRFAGSSFDLDQPGADRSGTPFFMPSLFEISCSPCRPGELLTGGLRTIGEVDLGVGSGVINRVEFPSLAFRGSLAFRIDPVVFPNPPESAVFVNAPFGFTGFVRAFAGNREVFRHALRGSGTEFTEFVRNENNTFRFGEASLIFQFDSAATPEPSTWLLVVGGGALAVLRRATASFTKISKSRSSRRY